MRVRAAYVTDEEIKDMNKHYPAGGTTLVPTGRRNEHINTDTTTLDPQTTESSNLIGLAESDLVPAVASAKNTRPGDNRPSRGPSTSTPRTRKPRKPRNRAGASTVAGEVVSSTDSNAAEVRS